MYDNLNMGFSDIKAAIYARYSTDKQNSTSVDDQIDFCLKWASTYRIKVEKEDIYWDDATSGRLKNRKIFDELVDKIKNRYYNLLIVYDTSRIYRNATQAHFFRATLKNFNVRLIGITDGLDSSQVGSGFLYSILSAHNEFISDKIRVDTIRGQRKLALKKCVFRRIYGYKLMGLSTKNRLSKCDVLDTPALGPTQMGTCATHD